MKQFSSQTSRGNPREIHQLSTSLSSDSPIKKDQHIFIFNWIPKSHKTTLIYILLGFFFSASLSLLLHLSLISCLFSKKIFINSEWGFPLVELFNWYNKKKKRSLIYSFSITPSIQLVHLCQVNSRDLSLLVPLFLSLKILPFLHIFACFVYIFKI